MSLTSMQRLAALPALLGLWLSLLAHAVVAALVGARRRPTGVAGPGLRAWVLAWWREVRWAYAVFVWWQPFREQAVPDCVVSGRTGRADGVTGVVLLHGFLCNRAFWTPWMRRWTAEGRPFIALTLADVFGSIDDHAPAIDEAIHRLYDATGRAPLLVGHSMGGLVARAWWRWRRARHAAEDAPRAIVGIVTLGTPHRGTWLARFALTESGRQMREGSPWLADLAASETSAERSVIRCWSSRCDSVVFPEPCAHLAANWHASLVDEGHVSLAFATPVWDGVQQWLAVADQSCEGSVVSVAATCVNKG